MRTWYFTFCTDHPTHGGCCQPIKAESWGAARAKMCDMYGTRWCFQYSEEEWESYRNDPNRYWQMERELPVVEV